MKYLRSVFCLIAALCAVALPCTSFSQGEYYTRAMLVEALYENSGESFAPDAVYAFSDVDVDDEHAAAIMWARAKGFIDGYKDGSFRPEGSITREQFAKILYNYELSRGLEGSAPGESDGFPDSDMIHEWGRAGMDWVVSAGIFRGTKSGQLIPTSPITVYQAGIAMDRWSKLVLDTSDVQ